LLDFSTEDEIGEDDQIDEYKEEGIKCVVDAKSMLYLFGLELDYSEELIGGGFKVSYTVICFLYLRCCGLRMSDALCTIIFFSSLIPMRKILAVVVHRLGSNPFASASTSTILSTVQGQ
jgi:hypothetical protein